MAIGRAKVKAGITKLSELEIDANPDLPASLKAGGVNEVTGILIQDLATNRPPAGVKNRFFLATDTMELSRDNGTAWETIGVLGGLDLTAHASRHEAGGSDAITNKLDLSAIPPHFCEFLPIYEGATRIGTNENIDFRPPAGEKWVILEFSATGYDVNAHLYDENTGLDETVYFLPNTSGPTHIKRPYLAVTNDVYLKCNTTSGLWYHILYAKLHPSIEVISAVEAVDANSGLSFENADALWLISYGTTRGDGTNNGIIKQRYHDNGTILASGTGNVIWRGITSDCVVFSAIEYHFTGINIVNESESTTNCSYCILSIPPL